MADFQVAYLPIGVPTFHLESAQEQFDKSVRMLRSISGRIACPEKMLLALPDLEAFLDTVSPGLVIVQNVTFAGAAYTGEILRRLDGCPILLWTLREPVADGERLRLNSLTGAYSAANTLHAFDARFTYVFGSPEEPGVIGMVAAVVRAAELRWKLRRGKIAAVGHTPQGFGFGRALDAELLQAFGVTLESIEARELIDRARGYTNEQCAEYLDRASRAMAGLDGVPEANRQDFARLYKAYSDYAEENGIDALASRCWPDFFSVYGTPVCAVLSMLNGSGVASSCEADIYGALSMYIGSQLTGGPAFFGDPVTLDEKENTITYWHCGMAACSLARKDTGAAVGVHPNRKIGPVMNFGCEACGEVTVFRIGRKPDGRFRLFILEGKALDKARQFCGTSIVVQTKSCALEVVKNSVRAGWEPHFAVAFGDIRPELEVLADMLGLEACLF